MPVLCKALFNLLWGAKQCAKSQHNRFNERRENTTIALPVPSFGPFLGAQRLARAAVLCETRGMARRKGSSDTPAVPETRNRPISLKDLAEHLKSLLGDCFDCYQPKTVIRHDPGRNKTADMGGRPPIQLPRRTSLPVLCGSSALIPSACCFQSSATATLPWC